VVSSVEGSTEEKLLPLLSLTLLLFLMLKKMLLFYVCFQVSLELLSSLFLFIFQLFLLGICVAQVTRLKSCDAVVQWQPRTVCLFVDQVCVEGSCSVTYPNFLMQVHTYA
jgi:hypothetical protein